MMIDQRTKNLGKYTQKGNIPWNKGISWTEEVKEKISKSKKGQASFKGKTHTIESNLKNSIAHLGKKRTLESRRKQGESIKGQNSHLWRGGVSKEYKSERTLAMMTIDYKEWRNSVFTRDNYTCVECKQRGRNLQADHIKPWRDFVELRYDVSNGRTLCIQCHRKVGWSLFREANPMKIVLQEI